MTVAFHYPPELMNLLIDTIPLLCRSYEDTLHFFKGAGVADAVTRDLQAMLRSDRRSINKFSIVRTVLTRLNERGELALRERREVLKRVIEFEEFSTCWPDDQLKAKGLVAEIRRAVNVKDAFARMADEREQERRRHIAQRDKESHAAERRWEAVEELKGELFTLFGESDARKRGVTLERILNGLFLAYGILVREAFTLTGDAGEGIVEQIDGVIELDGHLHIVEMKWWQQPIGRSEICEHLIRIYHRPESRAIVISTSGFTEPAVATCKESLVRGKVITLCTLEELVLLLERHGDLRGFFRSKVQATILDKNPFSRVSSP